MSEYADPAEPVEPVEPARPAQPVRSPKRRRKSAVRSACNLSFDSAAANVPIAIVSDSPTLMVAAVEDLCWRLAVQDWSEREPPRADREAHAAWKSEAKRFNDKRGRVRQLVDEALMAS